MSKALAASAATLAAGLITSEGQPENALIPPFLVKNSANPEAVTLQSETGAVFHANLVPGSVVVSQDPKAGTLVRMELVFDAFGQPGVSIQGVTGAVAQLATVDADKHRPPLVMFVWGTGARGSVLLGFTETTTGYSLFLPDGTPVRAHMLINASLLG